MKNNYFILFSRCLTLTFHYPTLLAYATGTVFLTQCLYSTFFLACSFIFILINKKGLTFYYIIFYYDRQTNFEGCLVINIG